MEEPVASDVLGVGCEQPSRCNCCGEKEPEPLRELPLCAGCRDALARRPFPHWISTGTLLILGAAVFAGARSFDSFRAGIAYARGQRAEAESRFVDAAEHYQQVAKRFPNSTLALARLGIAHCKAGQRAEAARVLSKLAGRKVDKELAAEVENSVRVLLILRDGLEK